MHAFEPIHRVGVGRLVAAALIAALIAALLIVAGCSGGGRGGVEVDATTVKRGGTLQAGGPEPGSFGPAWHGQVAGTVPDGTAPSGGAPLISKRKDGVQAYDPKTGRPTWHYREPGRSMLGYALDSGVVILNSTDAGTSVRSWHTVGLDAATGRIRWESTDRWYLTYPSPGTIGGGSSPALAGGGTVVVRPEDDDVRLGIDVRTGDQRWKVSGRDLGAGHCDRARSPRAQAGKGSGHLGVLILIECSDGSTDPPDLYGMVDAKSGSTRWVRPIVPSEQLEFQTAGGVVLVRDAIGDTPPELVGSDGRRLFAGEAGSGCEAYDCMLRVSGPFATLVYTSRESASHTRAERLAVVDLRTRHRRIVPLDLTPGNWTWQGDGAGRLYRVTPLAIGEGEYAFPLTLQRLDLATGRSRWSPLPLSAAVPESGAREAYQLEAVSGDRVVLSRPADSNGRSDGPGDGPGDTELLGLVRDGGREPYELSGVDPADWPDACRLLRGVAARHGQTPRPDPAIRVAGRRIAEPRCSVETDAGPYAVDVTWVAGSEREADAMVDGVRPLYPGVAEMVRGPSGMVYRVGRLILTIEDGAAPDSVVRPILANAARLAPR